MASLREKVEAELEQIDQALRLLPEARRVTKLSVLELRAWHPRVEPSRGRSATVAGLD
jgi:hypothetical protein